MAKEKNINARIQLKHDIEANWNRAETFIPKQGEIIIYDIDEHYGYERFKVGDGKTRAIDLPFYLENEISHLIDKIDYLAERMLDIGYEDDGVLIVTRGIIFPD